jgi:multicomponent Na+:H+ antiporter subunit D
MERVVGAFLILPLVGALAVPWVAAAGRRWVDLLGVLVPALTTAAALLLQWALTGPVTFTFLGAAFTADGLSLLFLMVINLVAAASALYTTDYIGHYGGRAKFTGLLCLLVFGLNGVVLVRDLFSLYVYLEVASVASYVLVAYNLAFDGIESALKYLLLSVVGTGMVLIGLALLYAVAGTLTFAGLGPALAAPGAAPGLLQLAAALLLSGFALKAAAVPFHAWLPDAHPSAPAPISAMLSGVVIKVAGIYALTRVCFEVLPQPAPALRVLLNLGVVSMIVGAVVAYFQTDLKRLLAYSSISQIGYILIGLGLGNRWGMAGALFHVFNHALFKALLFLNAGAIQHQTGTRDLRELGGLEHRMRVTGVTSVLGTLSLAGIPPFNGFFSKLFVILGLVTAGYYGVAVLAVLTSILTLGYGLVLQRRVFFGKLNPRWQDLAEAPFAMSAAVVVLAALCLLSGVFVGRVMQGLIEPAVAVLLPAAAVVAGGSVP